MTLLLFCASMVTFNLMQCGKESRPPPVVELLKPPVVVQLLLPVVLTAAAVLSLLAVLEKFRKQVDQ